MSGPQLHYYRWNPLQKRFLETLFQMHHSLLNDDSIKGVAWKVMLLTTKEQDQLSKSSKPRLLLAYFEQESDRYSAKMRIAPKLYTKNRVFAFRVDPIHVTFPFVQWGIDWVGPLRKSKQRSYIIVAIDYFSKWIEAKALA